MLMIATSYDGSDLSAPTVALMAILHRTTDLIRDAADVKRVWCDLQSSDST